MSRPPSDRYVKYEKGMEIHEGDMIKSDVVLTANDYEWFKHTAGHDVGLGDIVGAKVTCVTITPRGTTRVHTDQYKWGTHAWTLGEEFYVKGGAEGAEGAEKRKVVTILRFETRWEADDFLFWDDILDATQDLVKQKAEALSQAELKQLAKQVAQKFLADDRWLKEQVQRIIKADIADVWDVDTISMEIIDDKYPADKGLKKQARRIKGKYS